MTADGAIPQVSPSICDDDMPVLCTAEVAHDTPDPVAHLKDALGQTPLSLLALFVSPLADFSGIIAAAGQAFPDTQIIGCTTAGEIARSGYAEGMIVAVGFPADDFAVSSLMIDNLDDIDTQRVVDRVAQDRVSLQNAFPDMPRGFAFLMVDGLSLREDGLTATISPALRDLPLFGASAGDGTDFGQTFVGLNDQVAENAAVLTLVRSRYRTHVFSLDHLVPTDARMVVTSADPERRIVKSINAEPAAREYARIVGKDPEQLDRFIFASHPVVVRIGGTHHVRAIQQVNDAGELVFFSAIDEGMVLTMAEPQDMAEHLRRKLDELGQGGRPANIIGCDCILRRIEAERSQMTRDISSILAENRVTGFSTYGEQIGPLHVNQTMTGVAFYRGEDG